MNADPSTRSAARGSEDVGLASLGHSGSLLERTAHGALWVIGWRLTTRLLGIIDMLILARLLVPADFGLVTLGYSFVSGLDVLFMFGIEQAIIRDDHPDRNLYDTGFTINLIRALTMGAILMLTAGLIARLLANPHLDNIVLAFGLMTALTGLTNIGVVDFRRYIAFDKEFVYQFVPRALSVSVAIVIAFLFRSYWALVGGIVTGTLCTVAFSYVVHPYRPRLTFSAWRRLLSFSLWMWLIGLIGTIWGQAPVLILGRMTGAAAVGILSVGREVASLPTTELVAPLGRACFSSFAAARQSKDNPADAFLRLVAAMALLTVPAGFGISLVAPAVVKLAFGAAWLNAIPLVEVLGIAGTLALFGIISSSLFAVHLWLKEAAMISATSMIVCVALLFVLVPRFGALGAALAIAVADAANQIHSLLATLHHLELRASALFSRVWRTLLATAIMTIALAWFGLAWTMPANASQMSVAVQLFGTTLLGAAIYFVTLITLWVSSGRPAGAEVDLFELASRLLGKFVRHRRHA